MSTLTKPNFLGDIAFNADGRSLPFILPLNKQWWGIEFDLTATIASTDAAAVALQDGVAALIREITIETSAGPEAKVDPRDMRRVLQILRGTPLHLQTHPGGAVTAEIQAKIEIPFSHVRSFFPRASLLDSRARTKALVSLNWGDKDDVLSGNQTLINFSVAPNLAVSILEDESRSGPTHRVVWVSDEKTIDGASDRFKIPLQSGPGVHIRRIYIVAIDNGVRSDAIVNNVSVEFGTRNVQIDKPWLVIRRGNKGTYQIGDTPFAEMVGMIMVDFDEDKSGVNVPVVPRAIQPELVLNVGAPTGISQVRVIQEIGTMTRKGLRNRRKNQVA